MNEETIKKLIADKVSFPGFSAEEEAQVTRDLLVLIRMRVNVAVIEQLSETDREEIVRAADHAGSEEVAQLLKAKLPNFHKIVEETAVATLDEFNRRRAG